ncbi:uncharacterized protein CEXT_203401 [Caerostris extrusa]|uniref:Uncharacterized protein n=1 Tax=Caerostris extrusa TaxID=172846 RepID=A0AAV4R582_CAEEX|nr:uncharacterized protein CEXT_203401 [Caerostris extrusa]
MITTSQPLPTTKEADTYKAETTTSLPTTLAPFTEVDTIKLEESTTTPKPLEPVFDPSMEENKRSQNKSGIHDNSSGVRKILGDVVTLPPSKVELSLTDASNIITVLPVIITMPTTVAPKEESEKSSVTMDDTDVGVVTELGGNLKKFQVTH